MTPEQAAELAKYLKEHREAAGVSQRQLAKQVDIAQAQLVRLEQGLVLNPRPEVLAGYAEAIGVPAADVFSMARMPLARGLPTLRPYLRTKYRDLPPEDADKVEALVNELMERHRSNGPTAGEDEHE